MDSKNRFPYNTRLFLVILLSMWSIVGCFLVFQYIREKQYKRDLVNDRLQIYNLELLDNLEDGIPLDELRTSVEPPFEGLRISVLSLDGKVLYDSQEKAFMMNGHSSRPEIVQTLSEGSGFAIGRLSETTGKEYFYSATRGDNYLVRSAIPYTCPLKEMLKTDSLFLLFIFIFTVAASIGGHVYMFSSLRQAVEDRDREHRTALEHEQEKIRLKRQLSNDINHELKTPVAVLQVCLETLGNGTSLTPRQQKELIDKSSKSCDRLRCLLNDVSLITRMEEGGDTILKEPLDLRKVIDDLAAEMEPYCQEKHMEIHIDASGTLPMQGNRPLVESIFRNLIANSVFYSEGKNICISVSPEPGSFYSILFEDDGIGVDPVHLPHLFERFYRVDKGRSRKLGGTGLGLSIVKHAVQFHGGLISVCNRKGGGLEFGFTLRC